jgi:hypothetical protein
MIFPDAAFQIFPPEPSKSQGIKVELLSKTLLRKNYLAHIGAGEI